MSATSSVSISSALARAATAVTRRGAPNNQHTACSAWLSVSTGPPRVAGGVDVHAGGIGDQHAVRLLGLECLCQICVLARRDTECLRLRLAHLPTDSQRPEPKRSPVARMPPADRAQSDNQPLH